MDWLNVATIIVAMALMGCVAYRDGRRDERRRIHRAVQEIADAEPLEQNAHGLFSMRDGVRQFYVKVQNAIWERT